MLNPARLAKTGEYRDEETGSTRSAERDHSCTVYATTMIASHYDGDPVNL